MNFARLLVVSAVACASLSAQGSTSQINGTVTDQSASAVPGAEVKATQTATGAVRTVKTAADGSYVLQNLPVGPYQLEIGKEGFSKYVQTGIVLQVDTNPTLDAQLKIGSISDQVVVNADAALVETHSTGVGTVIDQQRVVDLPLNGREATQLIYLAGLASDGAGANLNTVRNYPTVNISVAGGQGNGITYLLDGATHNDSFNNLNLPLPFPDALQEFKVETSALPAEYGLHSAAAVNAITKSGTNAYHGDLFEFLRNGDFNARDYFATSRDTLKRNQYGGTVGGPIRKNKLFFFGAYQGTVVRSDPPQSIAYVPTAAELAGDFTAVTSPACNNNRQINLPASLGFTGNRISPSLFSKPALNLSALLPSTSDQCGKTVYGLVSNTDERLGVGKVDYQINDKHSIFFRTLIADLDQSSTYDGKDPLTINNAAAVDKVYSATLGDTYLINSGTVSAFHATLNRTVIQKTPDNGPSWTSLGVNLTSGIPEFSRVTVSGNGFSYGGPSSTPSTFNTTNFQFSEDFSLVRGSHQMGFGGNYIHPMLNFFSGLNAGGGITFSGQITGLSQADFLLGSATAFNQGTFSVGYFRQHYLAMYAQDSWKVTARLTMSYGVRWEPYIAPYSKYNTFSHFDPGSFTQNLHSGVFPNGPAGLFFQGDPQYTIGTGSENSTWNKFVPRVGIVWDPKGDGRMTIRASYGMFTDREHLFYNDAFANNAPFGNNIALTSANFVNPWSAYPGGNPFPLVVGKNSTFPLFGSYVNHSFDAKPTYLNQWNLSIQRQLGNDWLATANYVGNNTVHLWTGTQGNPEVYLPGASTANGNQRRILYLQNPAQGQFYGSISQMDTGGTASYNGLLLSIQHRLSHGVTLLSNYTWSHCLSDLPNSELGTAGPLYTIPNNRRADHGNCITSDQRQAWNNSLVARMPKFSGKLVQGVAGDWQLSTILTVKSGHPLTVTTGVDTNLTGQPSQRPNLVLADAYTANPGVSGWLNPAAFDTKSIAGGTYGNLGPDNLFGPGLLQIDMSVTRDFHIREKQTLQFRAEFFNVINTLNPSNPVLTLNSGNFGQITSDVNGSQGTTGDPRIIQLALKYLF
jgi:hypothetical protein